MTARTTPLRRSAALVLAVLAWLGLFHAPCAAETGQLRIGVQFGIGYLPVYVARDAGLFEKHLAAIGLAPVPVTIVPVTGAPQINDGLLSGSMELGSGGITAMMVAWDKTRALKSQAMKGIVALSAFPYELLTVDPAVRSLKDLGARNKIGLPAVKVSVPAIFLQMAAERAFGLDSYGQLDPLTVSLAQPDGATSLLSGGGTVDSYVFAPPFNYQLRASPNIRRVWSSTELTGGAITSLTMWTTTRFRDENPTTYRAVVAALRDAVGVIAGDRRRAAEIFIRAEGSKLPVDAVADILAQPDLEFSTAPRHSLDLATFLARTGSIKSRPADWKDYFFPEAHTENGS